MSSSGGAANRSAPVTAAAVAAALALLVSACAPPTPPGPPPKPERVTLPQAALTARDEGRYADAAGLVEQAAAGVSSPQAQRLLLRAGLLYERAGDAANARRLLQSASAARGDTTVDALATLLEARLALPEDGARALKLLRNGPPEGLPQPDHEQWLRTLARAQVDQSMPLQAVDTLVRRGKLLDTEAGKADNQAQLWHALNTIPMDTLRSHVPGKPDIAGGWLELAYAVRNNRLDADALSKAVNDWIDRYPQHPATTSGFAAKRRDAAVRTLQPPSRLAVLLPLTGALADYGRAVERGFLAAYYQTPADQRPALHIYDVGKAGMNSFAAYRDAVENGADLVIGPLSKHALQRITVWGNYPVPLLALNRVSSAPDHATGLYQFGLAPEDDAVAAAALATRLGYRRAVSLTPDNDWGQRIETAFRKALADRGGRVLEHAAYPPDADDFSDAITAVLNLDASARRYRQLRSTLHRDINYQPRRRQDVQFVFMAALPSKARLLRPQIRFHHGIGLPVIATSHAYSGHDDPEADQDMNGLDLVEIPWLTGSTQAPPLKTIQSAATHAWPKLATSQPRLMALGADAYRLAAPLDVLAAEPTLSIPGLTGRLAVDGNGVIHRGLDGARIDGGHLKPLPDISEPLGLSAPQ